MIKVIYKENLIKVSGHAMYAAYGSDIVCASASSIIYTTINGILNMNSNALNVNDNNDELTIKVISDDQNTKLLINNMLDLLKDLEKQYPKNIKISKGE